MPWAMQGAGHPARLNRVEMRDWTACSAELGEFRDVGELLQAVPDPALDPGDDGQPAGNPLGPALSAARKSNRVGRDVGGQLGSGPRGSVATPATDSIATALRCFALLPSTGVDSANMLNGNHCGSFHGFSDACHRRIRWSVDARLIRRIRASQAD